MHLWDEQQRAVQLVNVWQVNPTYSSLPFIPQMHIPYECKETWTIFLDGKSLLPGYSAYPSKHKISSSFEEMSPANHSRQNSVQLILILTRVTCPSDNCGEMSYPSFPVHWRGSDGEYGGGVNVIQMINIWTGIQLAIFSQSLCTVSFSVSFPFSPSVLSFFLSPVILSVSLLLFLSAFITRLLYLPHIHSNAYL